MNKKLILLAIISFIVAILWKAPATLLTSFLQDNNEGLSFNGVSGSFWKGSAEQLTIPQTELGKISWTINPLGLLTATFKGHFILENSGLNANGDFVAGLDNAVQLFDTHFDVSGTWVNQFQQYADLGGQFRGNITELQIEPNGNAPVPPYLNGTLNWEKGLLNSPISLPEGNYQLVIMPDDAGGLTGNLASNNAPVDIKGAIKLNKNWQYSTDLNLKTTPTGKSLKGLISLAGRRNPDGSVSIKQTGSLSHLLR